MTYGNPHKEGAEKGQIASKLCSSLIKKTKTSVRLRLKVPQFQEQNSAPKTKCIFKKNAKALNIEFPFIVIAWKKATCAFFIISPRVPQLKECHTGLERRANDSFLGEQIYS
ncbi:hypothetical protein DPX16_12927 [Anabarilius grahami]|uniref:Uncharacterized protein n=1 Tax=Anabarilius grahami TaxID=495550 RepID=A0A3N0XE66_ANAGA|nr:hypothetical protein DPX16_12927 [Anabarilius grahami]